MAYDFSTLSPADFEDLCRDLVGREIGLRFEAFAAGPDSGMDGRHARGGLTTILQAKHYVGSSFAKLKATMKRERGSIDALAPDRYILATSRKLTPPNKAKLAAEIGPALKDQGDILGSGELNALLRDFPDIEKAHIKLWLSSSAVLERVLHSASHTVTTITKAEIEAKVRVYAQNPSFGDAQAILEDQHVLIVSGPPGVGKTTLAEMLSYAYLADGWQLVAVRSLDDGFGAIVDSERQVFLFDDFLGKIALDTQALAAKDSDLARFMRRVRTSPNARFILTTRAHIFEEARRSSEHLADQRLDISRYLLDVGTYTRRIRARILYNHLIVAGTPRELVAALIESGTVKKVVDHRNYNPRVIEWMTDADRLHDETPETYPKAFLAALANPKQLWDTAYRKHIPEKCRHLLLTMYFCSQYGVELDELQPAFEALHRELCTTYGIARDPKDFEEAIRILEGGFIAIRGTVVAYVNPSFRDYMSDYVKDVALLCECAKTAQTAQWAQAVWQVAYPLGVPQQDLKRLALAFADIAEKFPELPTWKKTRPDAYATADLGNVARIKLLLNWGSASGEDRFCQLAMQLAKAPPAPQGWSGFSAWREGAELIELVGELGDDDYYGTLSIAAGLADALEDEIVNLLAWGMSHDELENMADAVEASYPPASDRVRKAAMEAIRREIDDVELSIGGIDSESTLEDHATTLKKLAPRADVPPEALARALAKVEERILELGEETSVADAPSIPNSPREIDTFDDAALRDLFAPLLQDG